MSVVVEKSPARTELKVPEIAVLFVPLNDMASTVYITVAEKVNNAFESFNGLLFNRLHGADSKTVSKHSLLASLNYLIERVEKVSKRLEQNDIHLKKELVETEEKITQNTQDKFKAELKTKELEAELSGLTSNKNELLITIEEQKARINSLNERIDKNKSTPTTLTSLFLGAILGSRQALENDERCLSITKNELAANKAIKRKLKSDINFNNRYVATLDNHVASLKDNLVELETDIKKTRQVMTVVRNVLYNLKLTHSNCTLLEDDIEIGIDVNSANLLQAIEDITEVVKSIEDSLVLQLRL